MSSPNSNRRRNAPLSRPESLSLSELRLLFGLQPLENEVCGLVFEDRIRVGSDWSVHGVFHDRDRLLYDKGTVLESEKRAWENSPEAQAIREALNPWRNRDAEASKESQVGWLHVHKEEDNSTSRRSI